MEQRKISYKMGSGFNIISVIQIVFLAFILALLIVNFCFSSDVPDGGLSALAETDVEYVSSSEIRYYVDEETGVCYIVHKRGYAGGITPRFNPDGTLYLIDLE